MPERLVDWDLAERLGLALAGKGPGWDGTEDELRAESERSARLVQRYTGLKPRGRLPQAELVDRAEWARINLATFREMSAGVEEKLGERLKVPEKSKGLPATLASAAPASRATSWAAAASTERQLRVVIIPSKRPPAT